MIKIQSGFCPVKCGPTVSSAGLSPRLFRFYLQHYFQAYLKTKQKHFSPFNSHILFLNIPRTCMRGVLTTFLPSSVGLNGNENALMNDLITITEYSFT